MSETHWKTIVQLTKEKAEIVDMLDKTRADLDEARRCAEELMRFIRSRIGAEAWALPWEKKNE